MIGNNDWLDYMEYRDYIAHSMGMWDKSKVKYKDKIPVGGGKFRYIYDEPKNPRGRGPMQPRTVQQQRAMGRSGGMQRVQTNSRQASRPVSFRDRASGVRTQASPSFNFRGQADETRARREAERRGMEQQTMQGRAQNEQQIAQNKRPKNLFDHMGNALNAAGRMAGDAARGVGNWVGDRAREVGEAASGAWNNVTGGDGRLDLDDVRRGADSVLRGAGRAIGLEARSNLDAARNREDVARQMRDIRRVENEAANNPNVGKSEESKAGYRDRYTQAAQEHGAASRDLREAQNAYDNTLAGRVENTANAAGNWLGDTARNVGDWFSDRAKDVGDWVGDRAGEARDAVSGMVDQAGRSLGSVYDQMSGRENGTTWNNVTGGDNHFNYEDVGNVANAAGRRAQNVGNWIGDRAREVQGAASNAWDNVTAGDGRFDLEDANRIAAGAANRVSNAARSAGQWMGDRAGEARDTISRGVDQLGARAGSAYDRMTGREDGTTWNNITGGDNHFNYGDVQNVADAAGRRARNLYDQAGNAIGGVGDWIGDRAKEAGYYLGEGTTELGNLLRGAGQLAGDTARNVGGWVDQNITGNTARNNASKAYEDERHYKQLADDAHNSAQNHFTDYQQTGNPDARESAGIMADWAINDRLNAKDARQRGDYYQQQADRSLFGRVGNAANAAGQWIGDTAGNISSAARSLIQTAGGNINQALGWAQQRLRYAQNTGNPQMEQDAQAVLRDLENIQRNRL